MPEHADKTANADPAPEPREHIVRTEHSLVVNGRTLDYTATCGTLLLRLHNDTQGSGSEGSSGTDAPRKAPDKASAAFFFIAYTLNDDGASPSRGRPQADDLRRPPPKGDEQSGKATLAQEARALTFAFNGGPGSSSVWLHLGLLGPLVVATDDTGLAPPPP